MAILPSPLPKNVCEGGVFKTILPLHYLPFSHFILLIQLWANEKQGPLLTWSISLGQFQLLRLLYLTGLLCG